MIATYMLTFEGTTHDDRGPLLQFSAQRFGGTSTTMWQQTEAGSRAKPVE